MHNPPGHGHLVQRARAAEPKQHTLLNHVSRDRQGLVRLCAVDLAAA